MTAIDFINATDFVPICAIIIAFFTNDRESFRWSLAIVALWLCAACVLAAVRG